MWPLAVLTVIVVVLAASGFLPQWPGLVHLVALPPLDLFADLRIIDVQAPSWPMALLGLAAVLVLRVIVLAYSMGAVTRANLVRATWIYSVVSLPMLIAALSMSVASAMPNARSFWGGLGIVTTVAVLTTALPWHTSTRLRSAFSRSWGEGLRLEVLVGYFAALLGIGAVAHLYPAMTLWLVPVSALATALTLRALKRPPVRYPRLLLATVATAALLAAGAAMWPRWSDYSAQEPTPQEGSLMLMGGIVTSSGGGTMVESDPEQLGYTCEQTYYFSYPGPGEGQPQGNAVCPIITGAPYEPEHTQQPLEDQVDAFAAQTQDLPRPLVVAGHSHAIWVAWEALADSRAEVDALVLLGPLPDSPVGYPPPGENRAGRVLGDVLRLAAPLGERANFEFDPDAPAAHQLQGTPNSSREILQQELPAQTRVLSVMTAGDLPLLPGGWRMDVERNACPVREAHTLLPVSDEYAEEFIRFLENQPERKCSRWPETGAILALPFGAPPTR